MGQADLLTAGLNSADSAIERLATVLDVLRHGKASPTGLLRQRWQEAIEPRVPAS